MTTRLNRKTTQQASDADAVRGYKKLLLTVLQERPSGTRLRLAEELGKNRSFVSQFSNPGYKTPIPPRHLQTIFEVCHFSPQQQQAFMEAYRKAHPRRARALAAQPRTRQLTIEVPNLGTASGNRALARLVTEFAVATARLLKTASE